MSFVIIRGERFALDMGRTLLGGPGPDALPASDLAALPPCAAIEYPVEGATTIHAIGDAVVFVNGEAIGSAARELSHGDHIELAGVRIAFGDIRTAGRTNAATSVTDELVLGELLGSSVPAAPTGGRLTRRSDGAAHPIPETGLTIGRDPDCAIVLRSKSASRRHATVTPGLLGYVITDHSSNGVFVNGVRIPETRLLGLGDVVRIDDEEFFFEADEASFESPVRHEEPARPGVMPTPIRPKPSGQILASLEVLSEGPLKGQRHRIERPTVQIGRGTRNDIQLENEGVSGVHASLVLRGSTWHVLDLGSRNGTFVEGEVVREPRALPFVCELRLGPLALLFRAIGVIQPGSALGTIGVIGLSDADIAGR